jgi:hypothetical protein
MTPATIRPPADYWALGRATSRQQIAAERMATKAAELRRIVSLNMTEPVRQRARELRQEMRALCAELRESGL